MDWRSVKGFSEDFNPKDCFLRNAFGSKVCDLEIPEKWVPEELIQEDFTHEV